MAFSQAALAKIRTDVAWSSADDIYVRGHNLANDLIGKVDLAGMTYLLITGRMPEERESRMLNAIMVTIAEHGITPSVIAARVTYLGAPEALQGAVAAGLLGAGSVYLGAMEETARLLTEKLAARGEKTLTDLAQEVVRDYRSRRAIIPGIGHPIHTGGDPRVGVLFKLAEENGFRDDHINLLEVISAEASESRGKLLPVNAAGAIGAICAAMGFDWRISKGFALIARTIGLVAHLSEEIQRPMGSAIWAGIEGASDANRENGHGGR